MWKLHYIDSESESGQACSTPGRPFMLVPHLGLARHVMRYVPRPREDKPGGRSEHRALMIAQLLNNHERDRAHRIRGLSALIKGQGPKKTFHRSRYVSSFPHHNYLDVKTVVICHGFNILHRWIVLQDDAHKCRCNI